MTPRVTPRVTVIIPTHNRRGLLEEALARIRVQSGVSWDVIVVDDASTDDTWAWLCALNDPRITVLRQEVGQRQAVARNRALAQARGEYVLFLDDDDLLHPGALATLASALDTSPRAVAAIGAREDWFTNQGYTRRDVHPRVLRVRDISGALMAGWSAIPSQTLFRTALARDVGGYTAALVPCDDRDMLHRVCVHGPVVLCPETVVTYRIMPSQWRPANVRQLRERVARRAIRALPKERWRDALRVRVMVRLLDAAEDQCHAGSLWRAAVLLARALGTAPRALLSPMIAVWVARRLAGRVARRIVPAPSAAVSRP